MKEKLLDILLLIKKELIMCATAKNPEVFSNKYHRAIFFVSANTKVSDKSTQSKCHRCGTDIRLRDCHLGRFVHMNMELTTESYLFCKQCYFDGLARQGKFVVDSKQWKILANLNDKQLSFRSFLGSVKCNSIEEVDRSSVAQHLINRIRHCCFCESQVIDSQGDDKIVILINSNSYHTYLDDGKKSYCCRTCGPMALRAVEQVEIAKKDLKAILRDDMLFVIPVYVSHQGTPPEDHQECYICHEKIIDTKVSAAVSENNANIKIDVCVPCAKRLKNDINQRYSFATPPNHFFTKAEPEVQEATTTATVQKNNRILLRHTFKPDDNGIIEKTTITITQVCVNAIVLKSGIPTSQCDLCASFYDLDKGYCATSMNGNKHALCPKCGEIASDAQKTLPSDKMRIIVCYLNTDEIPVLNWVNNGNIQWQIITGSEWKSDPPLYWVKYKCHMCGEKIGNYATFIIRGISGINRWCCKACGMKVEDALALNKHCRKPHKVEMAKKLFVKDITPQQDIECGQYLYGPVVSLSKPNYAYSSSRIITFKAIRKVGDLGGVPNITTTPCSLCNNHIGRIDTYLAQMNSKKHRLCPKCGKKAVQVLWNKINEEDSKDIPIEMNSFPELPPITGVPYSNGIFISTVAKQPDHPQSIFLSEVYYTHNHNKPKCMLCDTSGSEVLVIKNHRKEPNPNLVLCGACGKHAQKLIAHHGLLHIIKREHEVNPKKPASQGPKYDFRKSALGVNAVYYSTSDGENVFTNAIPMPSHAAWSVHPLHDGTCEHCELCRQKIIGQRLHMFPSRKEACETCGIQIAEKLMKKNGIIFKKDFGTISFGVQDVSQPCTHPECLIQITPCWIDFPNINPIYTGLQIFPHKETEQKLVEMISVHSDFQHLLDNRLSGMKWDILSNVAKETNSAIITAVQSKKVPKATPLNTNGVNLAMKIFLAMMFVFWFIVICVGDPANAVNGLLTSLIGWIFYMLGIQLHKKNQSSYSDICGVIGSLFVVGSLYFALPHKSIFPQSPTTHTITPFEGKKTP